MLANRGGATKPKHGLATLRLDEFRSGRETTTHQYRSWRKQVLITQRLHGLSDPELALVMYTQVKGWAKQLLEILEVKDLEQPGGLAMIWSILDRAHERTEHERADDAYAAWETAHRRAGSSIEEWLTYLRNVKRELEAQDPNIVITDKQWASKMLQGAGLPYDKKAQILFNCGGAYDPLRMETVLRVSFPKIGDYERKQGIVVPRVRQGFSRGKGAGKSAFQKQYEKPRDRNLKETHEMHEYEEAEDSAEAENEDDEQNEVYLEDQRQSDEQEELEEDDQGEDEPDEEFLEAFMAAWSAKKKTTQHRLSRGFVATKGKGQSKSARPSSASVKSEKTDSCSQVDPRKAASRCADCKQLGHWKGDPECPRVKDGKTPRYEKTGGGKTDKKPPHKIHWIGAVSSRGTQEVVTPPSAEIVSLRRNVGRSASGKTVDNVELRFSSKRLVDYITDRLDRGSEIFFGSRTSGGLIKEYRRLIDDNHRSWTWACCWLFRPPARNGARE
jgi:hypothetical protein